MCYQEIFLDENISVMVCECFIGISINTCTIMCIIFVYMLSTLMTTIAYQDDSPDGPTYFIPQPNNVTYRRGQTAVLLCSIENLGKKFVIWRRASEPNPISVGEIMFSTDPRYNISFSRERREFNLLIQNVQVTDTGVYECQVSSKNKIIRHILLKVNATSYGKPLLTASSRPQNPPYSMPAIVVTGKQFVTSGDTIRIECNVSGVTDMPQDLDWFKNGNMLRPVERKISISKDSSIAQKTLHSVLEIRNSKLDDSGTYVCRNSELLIGSQRVQVLNELKTTLPTKDLGPPAGTITPHENTALVTVQQDLSTTGSHPLTDLPLPSYSSKEEKSNTGKRGTAGEATSGQMCNRRWWAMFISVVLVSLFTCYIVSVT